MAEYRQQAKLLLQKQLAELSKNPVEGFSAGLIDDDDIYRWEVNYPLIIQHMPMFRNIEVSESLMLKRILAGAHHWSS